MVLPHTQRQQQQQQQQKDKISTQSRQVQITAKFGRAGSWISFPAIFAGTMVGLGHLNNYNLVNLVISSFLAFLPPKDMPSLLDSFSFWVPGEGKKLSGNSYLEENNKQVLQKNLVI